MGMLKLACLVVSLALCIGYRVGCQGILVGGLVVVVVVVVL